MSGLAVAPEALDGLVGHEVGVSDWCRVDQSMIDGFAEVTGDHQFIHVDPARARAETEYGGTIAHGFLTLSLLSLFAFSGVPKIAGYRMGLNYGFDRVRFVAPVRAGERVRGRFALKAVERRGPAELGLVHAVTVEIEDRPKPALVADWRTLAFL